MKPYKQKRKDLELKLSRKPKNLKHRQWLKATKKVAIYHYRLHHDTKTDEVLWDAFLSKMQHELSNDRYSDAYGVFQCDFFELNPYFILFKKWIKDLHIKQQKAEFLKQNYEPLESDLFEL